jgi:hypothetical protein
VVEGRLEPDAQRLISELSKRSGRSTTEELHDAVRSWYLSLIGDERSPQLGIPFHKMYSDLDANVVLRQSTPTEFILEEPFRLHRGGQTDIVVTRGDVTDLASVPSFLTWLVPRYGRHTLPALLHDQLVEPGMDPDERERADTILRDTMGGTGVPLVRRWLMWAGVSVATHWQRGIGAKTLVVGWLFLFGLGAADVALRLIGIRPLPWASSLLALAIIAASPLALGASWGRRYRVGVISAYGVLFVLPPVVAVGVTLLLYTAAEGLAQVFLKLQRRRKPATRVNPVRLSRLRRS